MKVFFVIVPATTEETTAAAPAGSAPAGGLPGVPGAFDMSALAGVLNVSSIVQ